jgi:hypothetical protein
MLLSVRQKTCTIRDNMFFLGLVLMICIPYAGGCVRRHQQHKCTSEHAHEVGGRKMQGTFMDSSV